MIAGVLACASDRAEAEDDDLWLTRPDALEAHVGAGTPVGWIGVMYDRTLFERISASIGIGWGSGREEAGSLQLAAGARLRLLKEAATGWYVGVDYSTGGWRSIQLLTGILPDHSSEDREDVVYSSRAHWLDGTVGYEYRADTGFALRMYLGVAVMLNPSSRRCVDVASGRPCRLLEEDYGDPAIPMLGLSGGFTM